VVANSAHTPPGREASTGELVKQLSEQVSTLVRDELKMARLELARKGKFAGFGIRPWLAALIVGLVLVVVSAVAALMGRSRMRRATPPMPEQAVEGTKADIEEVKEGMHR
jgi:membrane protein